MAILTSGKSKEQASHWYDRNGNACHTQPKSKGDGERQTTLKDAKRLGLLPSVTNILSILDKPTLTTWKINKALQAALEMPKTKEESVEYWMERVNDKAMEEVFEAQDKGLAIHKAIEEFFKDGTEINPALEKSVRPVLKFLEEKKILSVSQEQRIVSIPLGYAGTADMLFTWGSDGRGMGIFDFKTKKTKPGKKLESYLEHKCQLAAYAAVYYGIPNLDKVLAANIFISTTEEGRFEVVKHDDLPQAFNCFCHLNSVWQYIKGYDPSKGPVK